jgi:CBS-domain-containing membrane protein
MSHSPALPTFRLDSGVTLVKASPAVAGRVGLDAPAISVMTDLTQVRAAIVHPASTLHQAEQTMIHQGVRMLFVVTQMPDIEGLVTTTDLHGERQMRAVHERGQRYQDLCVADVMTPLASLDAVDFARMRAATVADAIAALQEHGRQHLLVVEHAGRDTPRRVRGVISRSQIERQTGVTIDLMPIASSFSEIKQALV